MKKKKIIIIAIICAVLLLFIYFVFINSYTVNKRNELKHNVEQNKVANIFEGNYLLKEYDKEYYKPANVLFEINKKDIYLSTLDKNNHYTYNEEKINIILYNKEYYLVYLFFYKDLNYKFTLLKDYDVSQSSICFNKQGKELVQVKCPKDIYIGEFHLTESTIKNISIVYENK